jgi:large conductance mechanosensitive channel
MALAIGVIIGAALGAVVNSLVTDIIMPPIGYVLGGIDFTALSIRLNDSVEIRWGLFLNAVIAFVVIAFVVYWLSKAFIKPEPAGPALKTCPYCRETVFAEATKCRYCASTI